MLATTFRQEWRRCGKATCLRCKTGPGHGPYWYAYSRDENGRLRSKYCGKAAPLGAEGPAARNDGEGPPLAAIRVWLLGDFTFERGGTLIPTHAWPRASARMLFALLLLNPKGLTRDEVRELLWPDHDSVAAYGALKTSLTALRRMIEPPSPSGRRHICRRLPSRDTRLVLRLFPDDWVDTRVFTDVVDPSHISLQNLADLVDLYRSELLPEYRYAEWTAVARESHRSRWHTLSLHLARRLAGTGQALAAAARLEAVLRDDTTQEEAARLLMQVHLAYGHRDRALQVYQRLTDSLEQELSVQPDSVSHGLAERARQGACSTLLPVVKPQERVERLNRRIAELNRSQPNPEDCRRIARLWAECALALESLGLPQDALVAVESGRLVIGPLYCPSEHSRLSLAAATVHLRQGRARVAYDAAEEAARLATEASEPSLQAGALRLQALSVDMLGSPEQAISLARSSIALYNSLGDQEQSLRSQRALAFAVWRTGRIGEAVELQRRNLDEAHALNHTEHVAYVSCGLGLALLTLGDLDAAQPHLQAALTLAARLDDHYLLLSTEFHLGHVWIGRAFFLQVAGRSPDSAQQEARAHFECVIEIAQAQECRHMIVFGATDLAIALAHWGLLAEARPYLALARRTVVGLDDHLPAQGWALLGAAELSLVGGDAPACLADLASALPLLNQASPEGLAQAHRVAALAWIAREEPEQALSHWTLSLNATFQYGQRLEELYTRHAWRESMNTSKDQIGSIWEESLAAHQ